VFSFAWLENTTLRSYVAKDGVDEALTKILSFTFNSITGGFDDTELRNFIRDKFGHPYEPWQCRPLDDVYTVVFMDAIHYKIRQDAKVNTLFKLINSVLII